RERPQSRGAHARETMEERARDHPVLPRSAGEARAAPLRDLARLRGARAVLRAARPVLDPARARGLSALRDAELPRDGLLTGRQPDARSDGRSAPEVGDA